jgi:ABC-type transporter Mla subunit MlaD
MQLAELVASEDAARASLAAVSSELAAVQQRLDDTLHSLDLVTQELNDTQHTLDQVRDERSAVSSEAKEGKAQARRASKEVEVLEPF